uniref:Uncharacterized protein n=1 Tax=Candidatus Kentrum sp. LFY TaxID=2126342 RepID=A0A450V9W7_9GAMM|nr:MAG: hypothetical protein BECKLFY1418A_GA0070994_11523 [Candidatus Kentron sp. LFY]
MNRVLRNAGFSSPMPGSALSVRGEASPVHFGWFRSQSIPHEVHRMPGKIDYQRTISKIFHGVKERDIRPFEIDTVAVLTGGNAEREIKKTTPRHGNETESPSTPRFPAPSGGALPQRTRCGARTRRAIASADSYHGGQSPRQAVTIDKTRETYRGGPGRRPIIPCDMPSRPPRKRHYIPQTPMRYSPWPCP